MPNSKPFAMFFWTIYLMLAGCGLNDPPFQSNTHFSNVNAIPAPTGFKRSESDDKSFTSWLRQRTLKKENIVRLYNGREKPSQNGHYVVLDMKTGNRDLQQCADAIIRLRAEYLFSINKIDEITFLSTSMQDLRFSEWCKGRRYRLKGEKLEAYETGVVISPSAEQLDKWLEFVFTYAGTYSLQKQLKPKKAGDSISPGDVIVEGGFPGHAMIVMDVCSDAGNVQQFMLAQSYMPAQDMHVVLNPASATASPWYELPRHSSVLETPDWTFRNYKFYTWQ